MGVGAIVASSHWQMRLTHIVMRPAGIAQFQLQLLLLPQDGSVQLLVIDKQQTLREVVEL